MEICDDNHDEIVFDSRNCPLCDEISNREQLERELNEANEEIEKLKGVIELKREQLES